MHRRKLGRGARVTMKKIIISCLFILSCYVGLHAQSTGEILTFPPSPEKGFFWGYALYLPKTMNTSHKLPILLIMTDCGVTDSIQETEEKTLFRLRHELSEYPIADELGVPLVMPIVQRPEDFYTHALSRAVFTSQEEPFKRLDLQVLNMLRDARQQLSKRHIHTKNKFLVTGFSAAGVFAWRWAMLHPEYVLALATGGALYHMLPIEELNAERLIYPVGVADMQEYTGRKFNKKAWSKIPILSTNGEMDDNDTFLYEECFAEKVERPVLQKVLPGKDVFERRAQSLQLLAKLAPNVQTHLYPWLGHEPVTQDVIAFFRQYVPAPAFQLTDTSDRKPDFPVNIVKAMWGNDPQIPEIYKQWIAENDFVLLTSASHPYWVYNQYAEIIISCNGEKIIQSQKAGSFSDGEKTFISFKFTPSDWENLIKKKGCKFSIHALHPQFLHIPDTLTVPPFNSQNLR